MNIAPPFSIKQITASLLLLAGYSAQSFAAIEVPEPMVFDLVRGLGAKAGEFEVNTLAMVPLNNKDNGSLEWAPEIEYAVADGIAIEFEVPFENSELEAYKFAGQFTLGETANAIHGIQVIYEDFQNHDQSEYTALWLTGMELSKNNSVMLMAGPRFTQGKDVEDKTELLFNATFFHRISNHLTLGLENDLAYHDHNDWSYLAMPQLHYGLSEKFELQFGVGAEFNNEKTNFVSALRLIVEFE
ncbi:MAG: hypothetical protein HRU20_30305 [Pseudomonadales bacterium]|nr:hypothetical protein [Pseudomonadales bacterium]